MIESLSVLPDVLVRAIYYTPVLISLFLTTFLTVSNFENIKKHFSKIRKNTWIIFTIILLVSVILRTYLPLCDDSRFWEAAFIGKDMLKGGEMSIFSTTQPTGYPILLSIFYSITETSYISTIYFNILVSTMTVVLVFLITYLITKDDTASLFSMIFMTIFPTSLFFSQFCDTITTSAFFLTFSVFFFIISLKTKKESMLLITSFLSIISVYVRLENFFIIPAIFTICYITLMRNKIDFKKIVKPILFFLILSAPLYLYVMDGHKTFKNYTPEELPENFDNDYYNEAFSMKYIPENWALIAHKFTNVNQYPVILYIIIFFSLFYLKKYPKLFVPVTWVIMSLLFFGRFWGLKIVNVDLYLVNINPPLAILYGIGILFLINFISRLVPKNNQKIKILLMIIFLSLTIYPNAQILLSESFYDLDACYNKEVYQTGILINKCIVVEETKKPFSHNLEDSVRFILPNKEVFDSTDNCKEGVFMKINAVRFELTFGKILKNNTFENCDMKNTTENYRSIEVYDFTCK